MTNAQVLAAADWVLVDGVLEGRGLFDVFEITRWHRNGPFYLRVDDFDPVEFKTLDEALLAAGWTDEYAEYQLRGDGPRLALVASRQLPS